MFSAIRQLFLDLSLEPFPH